MVSCRPSINLAVRQDSVKRANAGLIATRRRLSRTCACTTDDDDERRTIQDGRQSRSYMAARSMPFLRWADTAPVSWSRWRGGVWRCTLRTSGGRRAVRFFLFRHAAPRTQHPRNQVSSRRLWEIDRRLAGLCLGSATNSTEPPSILRKMSRISRRAADSRPGSTGSFPSPRA